MALDNNSFSIFLDTIKRFVDNKLIPREDEVADTNNIPNDIVEEMKNNDSETKALKNYNTKIHQSDRVENLLLPIRDGLMICQKVK